MNMIIRSGLCLLFIILLLLHSFQINSIFSERFYTSNTQLRLDTAKTYRKELNTLIGVLAYRIRRLLPNKTENKKNQQQSDAADEISGNLQVDKYKMPKETFQNSPPTAAFNTIKKRARTPKQMQVKPANGTIGANVGQLSNSGISSSGVGGKDTLDKTLYANSSPETRTMYTNINTLPKPVQIYLKASQNWYVFYNQSLTVAVNSLLQQRNTMLTAKNQQKKQRKETTKQNKNRLKETTEVKSNTLKGYGISE